MPTQVLTHVKDVSAVRLFADFGVGFTEIAHLVDVAPAALDRKTIDTTDIDTGGYMTYAPGLIDPGKLTATINFNPSDPTHSNASGLLSMFSNLNFYNLQVRWPDDQHSVWQFQAFQTTLKPDAKLGAKVTAALDFQLTGQVNFGAGPWVN